MGFILHFILYLAHSLVKSSSKFSLSSEIFSSLSSSKSLGYVLNGKLPEVGEGIGPRIGSGVEGHFVLEKPGGVLGVEWLGVVGSGDVFRLLLV